MAARKAPQRARQQTGTVYPPPVNDGHAIARTALRTWVNFVAGDPRLSVWEANFVAGIAQLLYGPEPTVTLTDRQYLKISELGDKVGFGRDEPVPRPDMDDAADDPGGYGSGAADDLPPDAYVPEE